MTEMDTGPYPGLRPSGGGNTATPACLYCTVEVTVQLSLPRALLRQFVLGEGHNGCLPPPADGYPTCWARVYKCFASNWPTPCYGGALAPFIGAAGVFLAPDVQGGLPHGSGAEELESNAAESSMDAVHQR